jgi:single-strand DNA-binding protein
MLNEAQISVTGYVATQPTTNVLKSGGTNVSMRLAWTPRRLNRETGAWEDGRTSYVTVICWRKLATNVAVCVRKGDPVLVKGKLSVRSFDDKLGRPRLSVEIDASCVGHDLNRGVSAFQRVRPQTGMSATEYASASETGAANGHLLGSGSAAGMPDDDDVLSPGGPLAALSDGDDGDWRSAETGIPLPDGPDDADFDESESEPAGAGLQGEPAAVPF